jgi:hypothetical protein
LLLALAAALTVVPAAELLNSDDEVDERCPGLLLPGSKDSDRAPAGPPVPTDDG